MSDQPAEKRELIRQAVLMNFPPEDRERMNPPDSLLDSLAKAAEGLTDEQFQNMLASIAKAVTAVVHSDPTDSPDDIVRGLATDLKESGVLPDLNIDVAVAQASTNHARKLFEATEKRVEFLFNLPPVAAYATMISRLPTQRMKVEFAQRVVLAGEFILFLMLSLHRDPQHPAVRLSLARHFNNCFNLLSLAIPYYATENDSLKAMLRLCNSGMNNFVAIHGIPEGATGVYVDGYGDSDSEVA